MSQILFKRSSNIYSASDTLTLFGPPLCNIPFCVSKVCKQTLPESIYAFKRLLATAQPVSA